MAILVLNPGSTTLKYAIVGTDGHITEHETIETGNLAEAASVIVHDHPDVTAIGCRVVHGGRQFTEPVLVTEEVISQIESLSSLAPLHNPSAAAALRVCLAEAHVPVVAVFDTAFHATMPRVAQTYGIDYEVAQREGLHRYGFHGIAHQSTSAALEWVMGEHHRPRRRLISCQLGGGASLCAVLDRKSVDTTMGMTPLEGLVMTNRSGDVDPGLIIQLLRRGWETERIDTLLNHESGFAGVSGLGNDPRDLLTAMDEGNDRASLALELYTYRIAKYIAALTLPLGGLDGIGFSGGIGQNSGRIRAMICNYLGHLGVTLDETRNMSGEPTEPMKISTDASRVGVWAIPTEEEKAIAWQVRHFLPEVPLTE